MRLTKFLSQAGICSRRNASRLVEAGLVMVNGEVAGHLSFVTGDEEIVADGEQVVRPAQFEYVLYNKPVGVDCVFKQDDPASIVHHLKLPNRLFPVGRLDKDSHGLLLLTNHGDLCHHLLDPQFKSAKHYLVKVEPHFNRPDIGQGFIDGMSQGVVIRGQTTLPCHLAWLGCNYFSITLTQGLNRQIRRMAQALGYKVIDLQRVRLANLELGELQLGCWRYLNAMEVAELIAS